MKSILLFAFVFIFIATAVECCAQKKDSLTSLLRLYEDNDFIDLQGKSFDKAYTHGFRVDYYYQKTKPPSFLPDRWLSGKGDSTNAVYGWGIMQTMITPANLSKRTIVPDDYRYSCSLSLSRIFQIWNDKLHYSLQSEMVAGIMGPLALGEETQMSIHRLLKNDLPMGWHTQLPTSLLVNINITAEKEILTYRRSIEFIGGVKTFTGTSLNCLSVYTLLRVGKMNPYFKGLLHPFHKKDDKLQWQCYAILRPSLDLTLQNAMIQGGFVHVKRWAGNSGESGPHDYTSYAKLNRTGTSLDYGIVISNNHFGLSFMQRSLYGMITEQGRHKVGNISIYVTL